jgi:hypothetical protein
VAFNLLVSCFWAFWGAIENFHEGWWSTSLWANLGLMLAQYLSPMLAAVLLGSLGLRWPRLGGLAYLIARGYFAYRFLFGRIASMSAAGFLLAFLMAGGCGLVGLLFWFGRPRPRRLAYHLTSGLPLAVALVSGAEGPGGLPPDTTTGIGGCERSRATASASPGHLPDPAGLLLVCR